MFKRKYVCFGWNVDADGKIKDVVASQSERVVYSQELQGGAVCEDWLEPIIGMNPASLYGLWLKAGFASRKQHILALLEIGKIKRCKWARDIASALREEGDDF
jgi:hypothetical protein